MEKTSFTLDRKKFHKEIGNIKRITPNYFKTGVVQINVLPEQIEIHSEGIIKYIPAETEGYCDVFVPIRFLYAYTKSITTPEIRFEISQGELRCGGAALSSPEIKIRNIFIADNSSLTMNAGDFELLKYAEVADRSELENFGLVGKVEAAKEKLEYKLLEAASILSEYHISFGDLKALIQRKFRL